MGYLDAVKVGFSWRIVAEAVKAYDKQHSRKKNTNTPGDFIYSGCGGLLFDSLPDRLASDSAQSPACLQGRGGLLVHSAIRSEKLLRKKLKPVTQPELFTA
jgi:hypothetical protein